jgi:hypothetical protein
MLDVSKMRPVDAFTVARQAVDALHAMNFDQAYRILGLETAWLEDSTMLEAVRIATARVNELMERAGLPPAEMPADPMEDD